MIALNPIRIRRMRPRAALRLAWRGRIRAAAARKAGAFDPLAFTFRRSRERKAAGPPPAMRTVDDHLLVLSPRLSLTLALSQTYAYFIAPPKDDARPFPASRHLPQWQRGLTTLMQHRIVSQLWRVSPQLSAPAQDSQVRSRWVDLANFTTRRITPPEANAGSVFRTDGPLAFELRIRSIAGAAVGLGGLPAVTSRPAAPTDRRVAGWPGSSHRAGGSSVVDARARARLASRMLRRAAFRVADGSQSAAVMSWPRLRTQHPLVWPEGVQRARTGPPAERQIAAERTTRTVPTVSLAYRAPKATASAETIAAPAAVRERTAPVAIDMNKLERDLWRQMERRVRIERERRGRQ